MRGKPPYSAEPPAGTAVASSGSYSTGSTGSAHAGSGSVQARLALRKRAEEQARAMALTSATTQTPEEIQRVLHELRVHQIELEMKNEELRMVQEQIEAGWVRYFALYDQAPVGYCILSEEWLIQEANLTAAKLMGATRSALVKQPLSRFVLKEDQNIYSLHCKKLLEAHLTGSTGSAQSGSAQEGESWECELRMVRKDGVLFWAHLTATAVPAEGDGTFCRVTITDITERKRVEEEHLNLERKLHQARKEECLGRMAGAIAHLFNNHLAVVLGSLELLADDLKVDASGKEYLIKAQKASRRMAETSGLMLAYLGHGEGTRKPLHLAVACREALDSVAQRLPVKVRLDTALATPGPVVKADAVQIRQVLEALLINATEALGETGGTITVTVEERPASDLAEGFMAPSGWKPTAGHYAWLSVADTGLGMTMEILERIFDPFFSTKFTGRGLGVSVVLGIVKIHGGVVFVDSHPGAGAIVRVLLPLSSELLQEIPAMPAGRSAAAVADGGLVLAVDDDPALLSMAMAMLRTIGLEAIVAPNGADAVEMFRQRPQEYCCVLCDLSMPGMNGWQTLSALRQIRADIPVILCSGYNEASVMADIWTDRPQSFLGKPYERKALSDALAKAGIGVALN